MRWCKPIISAFRRLRQEDLQFEDNMGYIERPCLKNNSQ
jgi:hypothetical protein